MRVLVHDISGHPFQIELSRELARRGHSILHAYSSSILSPRGAVERLADDPQNFEIKDIRLNRPIERFSYAKYSYVRRLMQEFSYGQQAADEVRAFSPDAVISANGPLFSQFRIQNASRSAGIPFLLWLQDFYSVPMRAEAQRRLGPLGNVVGLAFERVERLLARRCRSIVTITEDFNPKLTGWGVDHRAIQTIHNWAPIADLPVRPKANAWAIAHGLDDKPVCLYTGTLGLKHNPALLWALASRLNAELPEGRVVVASEGTGMDWLRSRHTSNPLEQLVLLPFQPFDQYADVLGAADLLLALLEPGAGAYAVPSKVLSYLCADRPILAAMPQVNLASRILLESKAGSVVNPEEENAFVTAAVELLGDPDRRREFGRNGRRYAEANFPIGVIADKFEQILASVTSPSGA